MPIHQSKDSHEQSASLPGIRRIGERLLAGEVNSSPRPGKRRRLSRMAIEAGAPAAGSDSSNGRNNRYAELHCHSSYSFMEGASHTSELVIRAKELGLEALALTDHDNLCGAMEFSHAAKSVGIKPVFGAEVTLRTGHHLTLLAENSSGYSNISQLLTHAHMDSDKRGSPALDPELLEQHSEGVICLSGCRRSEITELLDRGELERASETASRFREIFPTGSYFLELQQNFVHGDTSRNRLLAQIGRDLDIPLAATGNVHYHSRDRHRLQDVLVAIQHNRSLEETHLQRRPNDQFFLRSPADIVENFDGLPDAIENTVRIAERCDFDVATSRLYHFPDYPVPDGYTPSSLLRELCEESAVRKYGSITEQVQTRLDRELDLLEQHDLCGFILQYREIIQIAREAQEELGLVEPGRPVEDSPPGRGRGSSVAMLVGYLIGLSHIDPLQFDLRLERFLTSELSAPPDIDLDFPREIRERLILRVHERWGHEHAALTGMIATYKLKGAIRDVGMALGLPADDLDKLAKRLDGHAGARDLPAEMLALPDFRSRASIPIWQELVNLAQELCGFPKYLAQHPGGMVLSKRRLSEAVPLQPSAIDGRYIIQWDKDSADDAGFIKIDFLSLGALSQMNEALELIRTRKEQQIDISRIDFGDPNVYEMLHCADTVGIFQVESAAQMQTLPRLKPRDLYEMAWEVGAVRPGVGVNNGVTRLINRHVGKEPGWDFDHLNEADALRRTYGVVLYQDQLAELAVHVAGMSYADGDRMRRAFGRRDRDVQVPGWRRRFIEGAVNNGVPFEAAERIFQKFHGEYQFPESHAFAFGVTAYQAAWLKHYYPLEFYTALVNQQPMGFWSVETIKEDAKRHGITVLNPDVNRSGATAVIDEDSLRLGLTHVAGIKEATAEVILAARDRHGPFKSVADFMARTGALHGQLQALADAGCLDSLAESGATRREQKWEIGLRYRPVNSQLALDMPADQDIVALPDVDEWDSMLGEYRTMQVYPAGHIMASLRSKLPRGVVTSERAKQSRDGARVTVAGVVVRRQRPLAKAVFITLEDETGHSPLVIWPQVYRKLRHQARESILIAHGTVSRRDGTINIVVHHLQPVDTDAPAFQSKDWG